MTKSPITLREKGEIMSYNSKSAPSPPTVTQPVLIVEDDVAIGEMIALTLAQEKAYQGIVVRSGIEALSTLQEVTPAMLLIDYQLPDMNGIQLYDRLHTLRGMEKVPALLVSANLPSEEMKKRHISG